MVKRVLSLILTTVLLGAMLVACGGGSSSSSSSGGSSSADSSSSSSSSDSTQKTYRVAFIARAQADSFAAWLANEMRAAASQYPDITLDVFDSQANDDRENSLIENAIANKYDGIIVQANNAEAQRPYIEQIVKAGIPAIATNPKVDGIEGLSTIDADPYEQGAVNAREAVNQIPENANVVVLMGPPSNFHSDERRRAWEEEFFAKRPDVTILAEDHANWNKDEAMWLMEDWVIAHDKIDAIISMNDNMAAGALEVVKDDPRFQDILVYGVDGTAEAVLLIKEGKMTSTSLQSAIDLAKLNMETIYKLMTGEEKEIHEAVPAPLINASNVDEYIELFKSLGQIQ